MSPESLTGCIITDGAYDREAIKQGWTKFFGGSVPNPSSDTCLSKNDFNNHPTPTLNSVSRQKKAISNLKMPNLGKKMSESQTKAGNLANLLT